MCETFENRASAKGRGCVSLHCCCDVMLCEGTTVPSFPSKETNEQTITLYQRYDVADDDDDYS